MRLIATLCLLLISCGENTCEEVNLMEYDEKTPQLLCQQNMNIIISSELSEDAMLIFNASNYWNDSLGGTYFYQISIINSAPPSLSKGDILITKSNETDCAEADMHIRDGCMSHGKIEISDECFNSGAEWKETAYRHELGHLVGLDHNSCDYDLMTPYISTDKNNYPMNANDASIKKLKEAYCKFNGWCN